MESPNDTTGDQTGSVREYMRGYALKSIGREERLYGKLGDHDDMLQEMFLLWTTAIGWSEDSLKNVQLSESEERQEWIRIVRSVINSFRVRARRESRCHPLTDVSTHADDIDRRELRMDIVSVINGLRPTQRSVLETKLSGKTFEEIGEEIGLSTSRVHQIYNGVLEIIASRFPPS